MTKPTANDITCWNQRDPIARLKEMFIDLGQARRIEKGGKPARRSVFRKQHGVVYGQLNINPEIAGKYKHGIFAGDRYECALRFSSDTGPTSPDLKSTIGIGLKIFGVQGDKLFGEGDTADFIFQNMNRFFTKDAQQMAAFTTAGVVDGDYASYMEAHPEVSDVLAAMEKVESSCLGAEYWAILPFHLRPSDDGSDNSGTVVKYRLLPVDFDGGAPFDHNDYLGLDLQRRLLQKEQRFSLQVQEWPSSKPDLDNAMEVWDTPFETVAELVLPKQDINAIGQAEFGTRLSFNIWRTLKEHQPIGSIAEARKVVYQASADTRHQANGQSGAEPSCPNATFVETSPQDDCIVSAAIYPPIGVMRVGTAKEHFIGPEVATPITATEKGKYRNAKGELKRQAARFRIYGLNAAGQAVKELTNPDEPDVDIEWNVHLANQKSSWYEFQLALDIPEAADAPPSLLRNNNVADRSLLLIDGGSQSLQVQPETQTKSGPFEGKFLGQSVYLGEMYSEPGGRLVCMGGHGKAANINGDLAITFANNEGWYDDTADGPVTATVKYQGNELKVEPSWVICAPPDYAPLQKSVRTMWDLMRDVAISDGKLARPARPSFTNDILPIFQRMTDLQWVNAGFSAAFGWQGQFNYTTPEWIEKLGSTSPAYYELRRTLSNNFRRPSVDGANAPQLWPWIYGDAVSIPSAGSPRQNAFLSDLQLQFLEQWVEGDFEPDYSPNAAEASCIDSLPVSEQPDMLTRAAMEYCLADAFHPGCEMTWPMRTAGMYSEPFRLLHASSTEPTNGHYYGPLLNGDVTGMDKGPLTGGQVAGGITRWMAIPWHCDTASCRDGYEAKYDPYLPTFWPARVPNNMLSETMYEKSLDTTLSDDARLEAFAYRKAWLDDLPISGTVTYTKQINSMIKDYDKLAVVEQRPGEEPSTGQDPLLPPTMQVGITPVAAASLKAVVPTADDGSLHGGGQSSQVNLANIDKVTRLHPRR